jgi:hypothetical protein
MTTMQKTVEFKDGKRVTARGWAGLVRKIGTAQWEPMTTAEAQAELRKRLWVWAGVALPSDATNEQLIRAMEAAGMLTITEED